MDTLKKHWRSLSEQERAEFAAGSGTTVYHLRNCLNGSKPMGVTLAVGIERHSNGRFKADDLLPNAALVRKRMPNEAWPHPKGKPLLDVLPA